MIAPDERIVIDTNILVSAFLYPVSVPAQCLSTAQRRGIVLSSEETLMEASLVLLRPKFDKHVTLLERKQLLLTFRQTLEMVAVSHHIRACRDPRDDKILSLAVSGRADIILTGDADLLALHPFQGVRILSPADYLQV